MEIGKNIREYRKEQSLTQEQLARLLNTTQDTISLWELGKSYPDIFNLIKLARLFNISIDELIGMDK